MLPLLLLFPFAQVQTQGLALPMPAPAEALYKAGDWAGLADWFETVPPATRGAHYETWIRALQRSRRWERLVTVCEALQPQLEAKSGPHLGTYRLYRAQALSQLGRHAEAAAAHAENGRLGYPDGFPNACAEARLAQDWGALQAYAEALLGTRPGDAMALAWKGEALARQDHLAEAEPILREALAKDPKIAYAWNNLGRCLNERKAWGEACEALDRALALDPGQLEALFNRGRARFELKLYKESRDDFRAALALRPDDPIIAENLRQAERYASLPAPKRR
ncbi:tetratricopeptide repeat protein [Geothrix paludis]|uniref:tetratricopeptide repeat protein n=1 Tax=Geothrix paludis TaxID=2922722 RepID=UPI001FAB916B|nr:tetratricopeptide repeat protein [Geothrix paludis]